MKSAAHHYDVSAKYYDAAYAVKSNLVDLPFYLELARQSGGPVLEMGCGTGRVLLPIAREGIEIHGLDNSSPMLRVLKEHLAGEPPEVRRKVHLHRGDMRRFRTKKKFALVMLPFRPLQHMHTVPDQIAALSTAAHHLAKNGKFAFDVFYPKYESIFSGIGHEIPELEWPVAGEPARIVRRHFRKDSVDKIRQIIHLTFLFRTYEAGQIISEESERLDMSYYTYPQLQALFALAGLAPVKEYGSFAKTPLDNAAEQMIFILKKAKTARA
ncbi:MAG: class I SAM-dependent methyltransferase [Candidatus Acidiferrales bacterium]